MLGVLILVSLLLAWRLVLYKDSELISKIENHHIYLTKVQKLSVTRAKEKLLSHLITIDSSKEFLYSIKNKNREYLNNYMQPIYRKLQNNLQNMVDIYSIYLPKGTSFLRLHKPDIYGDNNLNSRPLLREVSKTKKITSGYEAGKFGLFYRIEYPVIYNSELVAIIDIGLSLKKLDLTLETIKKVSAVNLFSYKPVHKFQDKSSYNFENEFMLEGET